MSGEVLDYAERPARMKWWVVVAFVASVVTALGFFLVVPSLVALVVAIVVRSAMKARGSGGIGLANAAVRVSAWSAAVGVVFVLMGSSLCACGGGKSRELANRSVCAANLRGITQAMNSYAEENGGRYPLVAFAPYARVRNEPRGVPVAANVQQAMRTIESEQTPQAGSVPACLWLLVLNDQLVPKQFVCKSDPAGVQSAELKDSRGVYCDNFQDGTRLSYSMAYPWNSAGETGAWWKAAADASLPLIADMTPKQGSGSPAHNLVPSRAPSQRGIWNSVNHQGDGENVGFGDGHAEFVRSPDAGQQHDNIYGMSGTVSHGPLQYGGIPAGNVPQLTATEPPFDIVMLPVRDAGTGGM